MAITWYRAGVFLRHFLCLPRGRRARRWRGRGRQKNIDKLYLSRWCGDFVLWIGRNILEIWFRKGSRYYWNLSLLSTSIKSEITSPNEEFAVSFISQSWLQRRSTRFPAPPVKLGLASAAPPCSSRTGRSGVGGPGSAQGEGLPCRRRLCWDGDDVLVRSKWL